MQEDFDRLDGRQAVYLLHQQKQARMIEMTEQTRQEANLKQTEHCFELRSMIEKLSDHFDAFGSAMNANQTLNSRKLERPTQRYDPEMLHEYTLDWKSLHQGSDTYRSPLGQLAGLKKRAPENN